MENIPGKSIFLRIRRPFCGAMLAVALFQLLSPLAEAVIPYLPLLKATNETILLDLAFFAFGGKLP